MKINVHDLFFSDEKRPTADVVLSGFQLDVTQDTTVRDLKGKVSQLTGVSVNQFNLYGHSDWSNNHTFLMSQTDRICPGLEKFALDKRMDDIFPTSSYTIVTRPLGVKNITFDVCKISSVRDLKMLIEEKEGIPMSEQNLYYQGALLEDGRIVEELVDYWLVGYWLIGSRYIQLPFNYTIKVTVPLPCDGKFEHTILFGTSVLDVKKEMEKRSGIKANGVILFYEENGKPVLKCIPHQPLVQLSFEFTRVTVVLPNDGKVKISTRNFITVLELKQKIQEETQIQVTRMRLFYKHVELKDATRAFLDCVSHETQIELRLVLSAAN